MRITETALKNHEELFPNRKSTLMVTDPELLPSGQRPDRLDSLTMYGEKYRLRQLYGRATTEWPTDLQLMTYPPEAMTWLRDYASPLTPLICISESWPENTMIKVTALRQTGQAIVKRPGQVQMKSAGASGACPARNGQAR